MATEYYDKMTDLFKTVQEPFQDIVALNTKTLKKVACVKPEDWSKMSQPEECLEFTLRRGHDALEYLQEFSAITEKALRTSLKNCKVSHHEKQ